MHSVKIQLTLLGPAWPKAMKISYVFPFCGQQTPVALTTYMGVTVAP